MYGTYVLLEEARSAGIERYLQVSTDEVYGSIEDGTFTEHSPLAPSSPYSASKAGGDLLVSAYCHTYGMNATVCRASNNYGPYQYPEKLIPLCVLNAMHGDPLPVYGDGMQVRNWLYVTDHCRGDRRRAALRATPARPTTSAGPDELPNIDVVRTIIELTGADESLIQYVKDRPGHDRRYSLSSEKTRGAGLEGRGAVHRGHRGHRRLVPQEPLVVGADPLRRLPRLLPAPVRPGAALLRFQRLDTHIDGLVLVQPKVITDDRGFFFETYRRNEYADLGIDAEFVQDNHSRSVRGTIRALHFQLTPGQAKLIRVARGVDLRRRRRPAAETRRPTGSTRRSS